MNLLIKQNKEIVQIKKTLNQNPHFNGKVFTFPGEPIFYILFGQKPPFYPTLYEATPLFAQKRLVTYLQDEDITVVLYNVKTKSIHDEVPDIVRGRLLYKYITTHFVSEDKIGDYVIMKRKNSPN